jgi:hypothetical protein
MRHDESDVPDLKGLQTDLTGPANQRVLVRHRDGVEPPTPTNLDVLLNPLRGVH